MPQFLPKPTNISKPYWDGCREHVLKLQQCRECHRYFFYPTYHCPHCGGADPEWRVVSGRGRVHVSTVVESHPGGSDAPFVVALIELEEGPIMMSNVITDDPYGLAIGDPVQVSFKKASDEITLPVFIPRNERDRTDDLKDPR